MKKITLYIVILCLTALVSGCANTQTYENKEDASFLPASPASNEDVSDMAIQADVPEITQAPTPKKAPDANGTEDVGDVEDAGDKEDTADAGGIEGKEDTSDVGGIEDKEDTSDVGGIEDKEDIKDLGDMTDISAVADISAVEDIAGTTDISSGADVPDSSHDIKEPIMIPDNENIKIDRTADFTISPITDDILARIKGKSYPADCSFDTENLRYLTILHYGFDGNIHVGEIIVNASIASDTLEIFEELYAIQYPIEKLSLIDEYDADDEASMEDNNSSAFNYRFIAGTTVLSRHSLGLAIDINTLYNPYVYTRKDGSLFLQPENAGDYIDRSKDCPYYIKHGDPCYEIFTSHGFEWGGDWETKKDYQHFEIP